MLDEYQDILTAEEACEALRIGYNALYGLLKSHISTKKQDIRLDVLFFYAI